ncbi:MAG: FHA domain-containing protein [Pyrinomonadaceae bacterium]|nr:FHA domain-containing protein [Pyrinomonadaceae bacterium]
MATAKLKIFPVDEDPREMEISGGIISFGRGSDNDVSFPADSNVSRNHAEIESRGENFYVVDLESRNGLTVNGENVNGERRLQDGDAINFGGESCVEFHQKSVSGEQSAVSSGNAGSGNAGNIGNAGNVGSTVTATPTTNETPKAKSNLPAILIGSAVLFVVLIAVVIVAVVIFLPQTKGCVGSVEILSPESGETVESSVDIKVQAMNAKCIERVVYKIDGENVATAETAPFGVTLESEDVQQFADKNSHVLTASVVSTDGSTAIQKTDVLLGFQSPKAVVKNDGSNPKISDIKPKISDSAPEVSTVETNPDSQSSSQISLSEVKTMSETFVKRFSGGFAYKFDQQFLRNVQAKTSEYRANGFYQKAANYQDQINVAFIGEQDLDAPLGYVLAMSRSKFDNKKTGNLEGLWQMSNDVVAANGYNGQCGNETLSDSAQNCAARAAAIYTKALVVNLFQGDVIYGVSCFGMSPAEAGNWKITLPENRADFWNVIKSAKQRETLTRFFAAAIVAENPQKFDLKRDKPLSEYYKK